MDGSRFGDRTNVAHHCTRVQYRSESSSLSGIPRCQPDRATVPSEHGSFFLRMKLILRDVGAQTSTRTSVQDSFSGYTPRHFRSLSVLLSSFLSFSPLFPKVIRNGHEKDVKGWLLSVTIVVSVISRLYLEPRLK